MLEENIQENSLTTSKKQRYEAITAVLFNTRPP